MTCLLRCRGNNWRVFIPNDGCVILHCRVRKKVDCPKQYNKLIAGVDCITECMNDVGNDGKELIDVQMYRRGELCP